MDEAKDRQFVCTTPCKDCPYRKDAPLRKWHKEEFEKVLISEGEMFGAIFDCHKKNGSICIGYLMNQDARRFPNLSLRLLLSRKNITREYLDQLHCKAPMFESTEEMIMANYPELLNQ
jgi:hypothetical protein